VTDASSLHPFVQLEFTHALGPASGRFVVDRGADEPEVLIFDVAPAPAVRRRRMRGARDEGAPAEPEPVALALVTHVKAGLARDDAEVRRWVDACREDPELQDTWVREALLVLNHAIRAHRATCGDPYFAELDVSDPRAARIGYGTAPEVAAGRWATAFGVAPAAPARLSRFQRNAPAEAVAAALGGAPVVLQADELLLRALLDLDHHRPACAVLQLQATLRMLAAEAGEELPDVEARLGALAAALPAEPDEDELQRAASRIRTVLEARRAHILDAHRPS
jgi:hypothetical protein